VMVMGGEERIGENRVFIFFFSICGL
jgi:hypothetical protein